MSNYTMYEFLKKPVQIALSATLEMASDPMERSSIFERDLKVECPLSIKQLDVHSH